MNHARFVFVWFATKHGRGAKETAPTRKFSRPTLALLPHTALSHWVEAIRARYDRFDGSPWPIGDKDAHP